MPGLRLLGRRWEISSDDFVFPEITEGLMRSGWWFLTMIVYIVHKSRRAPDCEEGEGAQKLHLFIIVCLTTNAVDILIAFITAYVSSRGSIRNPVPRRGLVYLLYSRVPLGIFEFCWLVVGTSWTFETSWTFLPDLGNGTCIDEVVIAAKVSVILGWILLGLCLLGIWLIFDPLGHVHHNKMVLSQRLASLWRTRMSLFCCCLIGKDDNAKSAYQSVAELLSEFFSGVDMVATDILAGLVLLANQDDPVIQAKSAPTLTAPKQEPTALFESLTPSSPPTWMNLPFAKRILDFALGIYGWPYYACDKFSMEHLCALWHETRCLRPCRCDTVVILKDNCCLCHTAAFRLQTGLHETDLFYMSFHNQIYEVPFAAVIDHASQSIVVTVRGSMSLRDAVTDLCANQESLEMVHSAPPENGVISEAPPIRDPQRKKVWVHKGIMCCAKYVFDKLISEKILDDLFILQPDYQLVVTGHSLGAGVAAVLTLMLKERQEYGNVKCFAFSPPGCVVNESSFPFTQDCICSVILGDDMIPRLSLHSIEKMRNDVLNTIESQDRPKWDILLRGCYRLIFSRPKVGVTNQDDPNLERGTNSATGVNNYDGSYPAVPTSEFPRTESGSSTEPLIRRSNSGPHYHSLPNTPSNPDYFDDLDRSCELLVCPGRIIHIKPVAATGGRSHGISYEAKWAKASDFVNLLLGAKMVSDHMPYNVAKALKHVEKGTIAGERALDRVLNNQVL